MSDLTKTPKELEIEIRRPHFELEFDLGEDWFDGSAFTVSYTHLTLPTMLWV